MKKLIAGVLVLTILGSCGNKKTNIDPFASITQEVDSIRHKADSIHQEELPEEPKPTEATGAPDTNNYRNKSTINSNPSTYPCHISSCHVPHPTVFYPNTRAVF